MKSELKPRYVIEWDGDFPAPYTAYLQSFDEVLANCEEILAMEPKAELHVYSRISIIKPPPGKVIEDANVVDKEAVENAGMGTALFASCEESLSFGDGLGGLEYGGSV